MSYTFSSLADLRSEAFGSIIDVRSPAEFQEDHVPGAISLPVLSDEERARVGTIYKQVNPFSARKLGAALVAKNSARHLEGPLSEKQGDWRPLVYCWRGGQRSGSFAAILQQIGWRVSVLNGGYQSYRRSVVKSLYDDDVETPVVLLDGNTGTGKTEVLHKLAALGHQVIDLEGLANHRGSVLGGMGKQPSQKSFETELYKAVSSLDSTRPVLIEAESSRIGSINLPPKLFNAMKAAPRITLHAPIEARAKLLSRIYAAEGVDTEILDECLERLVTLRGRAQVAEWKLLLAEQKYEELASSLITLHYDPRYTKGREKRDVCNLGVVVSEQLAEADLAQIADQIERLLAKDY